MHTAHLPHLQQSLSNNNRFTVWLSHQTTKVLLLSLLFVGGMVGEGWGQQSITGTGSGNTYIQTFDNAGISTTYIRTPACWQRC